MKSITRPYRFPLLLFFLVISVLDVSAQYMTTVDTLNCEDGTPTFEVDLSSNPDSLWVSPPQVRAGNCCSGTDDNCVQFNLTLSDDAQGINFYIPGGTGGCGASPNGSLFYQVNCGPITSVGTPLCLDGPGPHVITFCKPGNNENCYAIQSIPNPSTAGDVITADGCTDTLRTQGLEPSTVTWNSIFPGAYGDYNGLLSDLSGGFNGTNNTPFTGFETVVVTPGFGSPSTISYEVCGEIWGFCGTEPFCDTVTVSIYPTLFADILPDPVAVCAGGLAQTLTAHPLGGTAPYNYLWSTTVDPTIDGATTQDVDVTLPGEYSVIIGDATGCPFGFDTVLVTQYDDDISVDAGPDITICASPVPSITLTGSSPVTGQGHWENYTGTFSTDSSDLTATYTPSAAEITNGSVELYLFSDFNQACPGDTDTVVIFLPLFESNLSLTSTNITCNTLEDGTIDLTVTGGNGPFTFDWNNDGTGDFDDTEDLTGLDTGPYVVVVQDINLCADSIDTVITEPTPVVVTINGDDILCFGDNDGNITGTISGGTAPYVITLDETGATLNVATDGGAYDFSGLAGIPSGGFDNYNVTVTDANGNTGGCLATAGPAPMTEPEELVVTINGDDILCFGDNDGNITGTISGGTAPYVITLDETGATLNVATDGGAYDFSGLAGIPSGGFDNYNVTVTDANGNTGGCLATAGPAPMTEPEELVVTINGDDILCFGDNDGNITGTITGGTAPYVVTLDETGATLNVATDGGAYDFSGLAGIPSGGFDNYNVTVTDANGNTGGCLATAGPAPMTEPEELVVTINGDDILCFGDNDGNITGTISGGTAPYVVTLDETGATLNVATDGGAYDFSGLAGIPSGGFDNYNVTVTDANGNTGGCLATAGPAPMTEPTPLTHTLTAAVYAGGFNVSGCVDDGEINLEVFGGTFPYTYDWNIDGTGDNDDTQDLSNLAAGTYIVVVTDANGCSFTDQITLIQADELTIPTVQISLFPSGDNISCFNLSDGFIDIDVTGGAAPYTYDWNNDGTGDNDDFQDLNNIPAGTYSVTITDLNNCTTDTTITLIEPTPLIQSSTSGTYPSGHNISCFGLSDGSIDYSFSGGSPTYTIDWSTDGVGDADDSEDLTNVPAGVYNVVVTDINGCQIDTTIVLNQPPFLTNNSFVTSNYNGYNISCYEESDGSAEVTINGGAPTYTILWTDSESNEVGNTTTVTDIPEGTYDVLITDINGCTTTSTVILNQPPPIVVTPFITSDYNGEDISCFEANDGSLTATASGGLGSGYTFVWTDSITNNVVSNTANATGLEQGTYIVTVTDNNGCSNDTLISITHPTPMTSETEVTSDYNGQDISCFEESDGSVSNTVSGGTPDYTYVWLNSSNNIVGNTAEATGLPAGDYTVIATDANGCEITNTITLTQPTPVTTDVEILSDYFGNPISCAGQADGILGANPNGGTPGYSFVWNTTPVQTTQEASQLAEGSYGVIVTDSNGCVATAIIDIEGNPLPIVSPAAPQTVCQGETVIIESYSNEDDDCFWTFSNGAQLNDCGPIEMIFEEVGCYDATLVVTGPLGCVDSVTVEDYICIEHLPLAGFTVDNTEIDVINDEVNYTNTSQDATSYLWEFGDGNFSNEVNPTHNYSSDDDATYTTWLYAYTDFGCVDSTSIIINQEDNLILYVPNTFTPNVDGLNETFKPVIGGDFDPQNYTLLIFNRWGELIFESRHYDVGWNGTYGEGINKECQDGTYVWKIIVKDEEDAEKQTFVGHVNLLR